jgi:hypothetical protein
MECLLIGASILSYMVTLLVSFVKEGKETKKPAPYPLHDDPTPKVLAAKSEA